MSTEQREELGVISISAREIYDQIVGLRSDVRSLTESNIGVAKVQEDHEERLRVIERWKYSVPAAAITAVVSAVVTLTGKP